MSVKVSFPLLFTFLLHSPDGLLTEMEAQLLVFLYVNTFDLWTKLACETEPQ